MDLIRRSELSGGMPGGCSRYGVAIDEFLSVAPLNVCDNGNVIGLEKMRISRSGHQTLT